MAVVAVILLVLHVYTLETHRRERDRAGDKWATILNDMASQHSEDLREITVARYAPPREATPDAIFIPQPDDAEVRASRQVTADTKRAGIIALAAQYRDIGLTRTEQELANEVEAVMEGRAIPV